MDAVYLVHETKKGLMLNRFWSLLEKNRNLTAGIIYFIILWYLIQTSWLKWPDPWIDFGYFLYNSWIVSLGKTIGRDFIYHYGPLALYFYAGFFRLFGPSIVLVYVLNMLLLLLDILFLHRIFSRISWALAVGIVTTFLSVFALGQYITQGNYNFLAPYKPEVSLGLCLLFAQVNLIVGPPKYLSAKWHSCLIGVLAGALLLMSSELALASIGIIFVLFYSQKIDFSLLGDFVFGLLLIPAFFLLYFWLNLNLTTAFGITFRSLGILLERNLMGHDVLLEIMGLDLPFFRFMIVAQAIGVSMLVASFYYIVCSIIQKTPFPKISYYLFIACMPIAVVLRGWQFIFFSGSAKVLPIFPLFGLVIWFKDPKKYLLLGLWSALSGALILRILLNATYHYYGFSLALGATISVFLFFHYFSLFLERKGQDAMAFRALSLSYGLTLIISSGIVREPFFENKTYQVSKGKDPFFDWREEYSSRGRAGAELIDYLKSVLKPGEKILELPNGQMRNYLLRVHTPLPYRLTVGELSEVGEARILDSFKKDMPRFVFIFAQEKFEEKSGFGSVYGREILQWIKTDFHFVRSFGQGPNIMLYERSPLGS